MSTGDANKSGKGQTAKKMESAQQLKELQSAILVDTDGLKVAAPVGHTVLIPVSPSVEQARQAVVERLQHEPDRIAALLEQGITALLPLLPEQVPWLAAEEKVGQGAIHYAGLAKGQGAAQTKRAQDLGGQGAGDDVGAMTKREHESIPAAQQPGSREAARCACGDPACAWVARAQAAVAAAWASGAAERLRLLGWTREALLAAVWAAWAAAAPLADAEAALRRAVGPRESERRPAAGPLGQALAERLAEAAEQGRLHEPAPEFHDVGVELGPVGPAAAGVPQGPDPAPWAAMLPGVRGAATGLTLVASQVMQRAEELAAPLRTKPQ